MEIEVIMDTIQGDDCIIRRILIWVISFDLSYPDATAGFIFSFNFIRIINTLAGTFVFWPEDADSFRKEDGLRILPVAKILDIKIFTDICQNFVKKT